MSAPALRRLAPRAASAAAAPQAGSMAHALDEYCKAALQRSAEAERPAQEGGAAQRPQLLKTFTVHIGADLPVPTKDNRYLPPTPEEEVAQAKSALKDPFEGMPLRRWAERLGERMMPAYEAIKEEQNRAKLDAKTNATSAEPAMPRIPHLLPFTRWAAQSTTMRDTFIAPDAKDRKKARLSWYHPDDTMVPRDWFKGGLLEDLKYYRPFSRST